MPLCRSSRSALAAVLHAIICSIAGSLIAATVCASLCINFCYCRDQELAKVVIKKEEVELIVSYVALTAVDQTEQTSTSVIIPAEGETLNSQC